MENKGNSHSSKNASLGSSSTSAQQNPREKSKRPQLSCNACRARKVKCDRVQPCTACSLHQIADLCQYDLTESERHPILQAEALREKDKEIARLRVQVETLAGPSTRLDAQCSDFEARKKRKPGLIARGGKKPANVRQKKPSRGSAVDSIFFGAPSLTSVIQELADLTLRTKASSLSHSPPQASEQSPSHGDASFPFPTLWPAKDGISGLVALIPQKGEIDSYLDSFQHRVQGCSFPHIPESCTRTEIERFLSNAEHNSLLNPDMLALLFATLAQGLQHGLYDRCGQRWVAGTRETESKKADVFIAASMQALRLSSYLSRPTLLVIETLVMIGPYLTDSGKMVDAWALFGITVRLAQAIGLHRDPCHLYPCPPPQEAATRKNLWWWMLHMDQQYSVTLGRPLGISSIGDCPTPMILQTDTLNSSLSNCFSQFSILARQILSAGYLCNAQIDQFTDQMLALQDNLPDLLRLHRSWLHKDTRVPEWPLNAQAAALHQKMHNFIVLLNRQRIENNSMDATLPSPESPHHGDHNSSGRDRVIESCSEILVAFEFFHSRVKVGLVCWTVCQQAFNAATILIMEMIEHSNMEHYPIICQTYNTFREIQQLGIHYLAGAAVEKIEFLMNNFDAGVLPVEKVMSKQGMVLLEHVGCRDTHYSKFDPLRFNMADLKQELRDRDNSATPNKSIGPSGNALKKQKQSMHPATSQKFKAAVRKSQRKEAPPQRRASSGPWTRENLQLNVVHAFSSPATPTNASGSSELSAADIESTIDGSPNATCNDSASRPFSQGFESQSNARTLYNMAESRPWIFTTRSSPTNPTFTHMSTSSISAPSSYNPTSFMQNQPDKKYTNPCSVANSRSPSLYMPSYPSSSYANSFVSSLQTASGLHTPSASHPVSPSLSHSQQYCLSQPQTQPQSPVWEGGFDGTMDCTDIGMDLGANGNTCAGGEGGVGCGGGRTWWAQGWNV